MTNSDAVPPLSVRARLAVIRPLLVLVAAALAFPLQAAIPATERQALIDFYNSAGGSSWGQSDSYGAAWLGPEGTECTWKYVKCNADQTAVVSLDISHGLSGTIPSSIGDLRALELLRLNSLQSAGLAGTIPETIGNLSKLKTLDLYANVLTGSIPESLSHCTNLTTLSLARNGLTGTIPSGLGSLSSLTTLHLYTNQLSGPVPETLGDLSALQYLVLGDNRLTGPIPDSLARATSLKSLGLNANALTGSIPLALTTLPDLVDLALTANQLSGEIPTAIGTMSKLERLWLDDNKLTGTLPSSLGQLVNLKELDASDNELTGGFPETLIGLHLLEYVDLSHNHLSGPLPASFAGMYSLYYLYLDHNDFTGGVPELSGLRPQYLYVNDNHLTGPVPLSVSNTYSADLGGNMLSGNLPAGWSSVRHRIRYNALYAIGGAVAADATQTIAPSGLTATGTSSDSVTLQWTPISYSSGTGFYQIHYSSSSLGPFVPIGPHTTDKAASSITISGLPANRTFYFAIQTTSMPHEYNPNTVVSALSGPVAATTCTRPTITTQPVSTTIGSGQSATLTVAATGGGPFSYQWFLGESPAPWDPIAGANGASYVTPALTSTKQYWVRVTNACGSTDSATATVTVLPGPTVAFVATPNLIAPGEASTLSWQVTNATTVTIDGIPGNQPLTGSVEVRPSSTKTYRLVATGSGGTKEATVFVEVVPLPTVTFSADPSRIYQREDAILRWTVSGATQVTLDNSLVAEIGTKVVSPLETTTYKLTATGRSGSVVRSATLTVDEAPEGSPIISFSATPSIIYAGDEASLNWSVSKGTSVTIDGIPGTFPLDGSVTIKPLVSTDYRLVATWSGGTKTARTSIEVWPVPTGTIPASERQALLDLYQSTNGASWIDDSGWLGAAGTECTWEGVRCNAAGTTVTEIVLDENKLAGSLPASLGQLTNLVTLNLASNLLTGELPASLANATGLAVLHLQGNSLSMPIPRWLENHQALRELRLGGNPVVGTIPAWLGDLRSLELLDLFVTEVSGAVPPELGNARALTKLWIGSEKLTGGIPEDLTYLSRLTSLQLWGVTGEIPATISRLTKLTSLSITNSDLTAPIPDSIGTLSELRSLEIARNQLSGGIPASIGNLKLLQFLRLNDNQLTGTIPATFAGLSSLRIIHLQNNELTGTIPSLNATPAYEVKLDNNRLTGAIPPFGRGVTLYVRSNNLHGRVPDVSSRDFRWNSLKHATMDAPPNGDYTQTLAPAGVQVSATTDTSATLTWVPIQYTADTGYYEVSYSRNPDGPFTPFATKTANKSASSLTVDGLTPGTTWYFVVRTTTLPHAFNVNTVTSDPGTPVAGTTTGCAAPIVVSSPAGMTINAGESVTLTVSATGSALTYQWYRGTSPSTAEPVAGANAASFTTPAISSTTSYWVRVSNACGVADSATAVLTVVSEPLPRITFEATPQAISPGESSMLSWQTTNATKVQIEGIAGDLATTERDA